MSEAIVTLRGIERVFPGVRAVAGVDLDLHRGEILGLAGKNGAGKSTLMKIMAGIEPADRGSVRITGEAVPSPYDPIVASRVGIAIVHQELEIVPGQSVAENVVLGAGFPRRGGLLIDWSSLDRRVRELVDTLHLEIDPRAPVDDLSLAQQRLVMIARCLYRDARVMVLDEPSAALNDEEIATLHRVVRQLAGQGCAVVYISHRLQEIIDLTHRTVVMRDARVVDDRATSEFTRQTLIEAITGHAGVSAAVARPPAVQVGEPVLEVEGLSRDDRIRDVSFTAYAGEVLGLAGLAGAGRTELARLIAGADRPTGGRVRVGGREVHLRTPREAVRAGIGLVPEDRRNEGLLVGYGTRFNVTLASLAKHRTGRIPRPRRRSELRATTAAVERLRITAADVDRPVALLSGGNQQKVALAKWLERDAAVLIFDEPTQGIDIEAKTEVLGLIRTLAAQGTAVLLISSDFAELVATCDRVLVLREGTLSGELEGAEITDAKLVEMCYREPVHAGSAR